MKIFKTYLCSFLFFAPLATYSLTTIKVVDQYLLPIQDAQVLIGYNLNQPFIGNLILTDSQGLAVAPDAWNSSEPITVFASGFIKQTVFGFKPQNQESKKLNSEKLESDILIKMNLLHHLKPVHIGGQILDLPVVNKDKYVDFALVTKAFKPEFLKNYSERLFLSPYTDAVKVLGKDLKIFSNASIPQQKETYGLTITLDKPDYRLFENQKSKSEIVILSGQFLFKPVVDELLQGKSFYDVINSFDIYSINNSTADFTEGNSLLNISGLRLPVNQIINYKNINLSQEETAFVIPMNKINDSYWPLTIKKLSSLEDTQFKALNPNLKILTLIKPTIDIQTKKPEETISARFTDVLSNGDYLPLIEGLRQISIDNKIEINPINLPEALDFSGQHIVLSKNYDVIDQTQTITNHFPVWEIYHHELTHEIILPTFMGFNEQTSNTHDFASWSVLASNKIKETVLDNSSKTIYEKIDQSNYSSKTEASFGIR